MQNVNLFKQQKTPVLLVVSVNVLFLAFSPVNTARYINVNIILVYHIQKESALYVSCRLTHNVPGFFSIHRSRAQ